MSAKTSSIDQWSKGSTERYGRRTPEQELGLDNQATEQQRSNGWWLFGDRINGTGK